MNTKVLLAALAGAVVNFMLGWVFYGMLLSDFMRANVGSAGDVSRGEEMGLGWIFAGSFVQGLLFALIFSRWAGINTFRGGAIGGAWVGFLLSLAYYLFNYGTTHLYNMTAVLTYPLVDAVMYAIMGGVIGWVLGYGENRDLR